MSVPDPHSQLAENLDAPADNYAAVTTSNTTGLTFVCRALYVGTGGDVVAVTPSGTAVTFKAVPTGTILPIRCMRVNATGTTAADLVALW